MSDTPRMDAALDEGSDYIFAEGCAIERELTERDNERVELLRRARKAERELATEREGRAFQSARINAIIMEEAAAVAAMKKRAEKAERELAQAREDAEELRAALQQAYDQLAIDYTHTPLDGMVAFLRKFEAILNNNAAQAAKDADTQASGQTEREKDSANPAESASVVVPREPTEATALTDSAKFTYSETSRPRWTAVGHVPDADHASGPDYKAWYDVVQDALVVDWVLSKENMNDPHKALNDLICSAVNQALDPRISREAQELIDRGKKEATGPSEEAVRLAITVMENEALTDKGTVLLAREILRLRRGE